MINVADVVSTAFGVDKKPPFLAVVTPIVGVVIEGTLLMVEFAVLVVAMLVDVEFKLQLAFVLIFGAMDENCFMTGNVASVAIPHMLLELRAIIM